MSKFNITIAEPSPEDLRNASLKWQARISPLLIDQWKPELHALSVPTSFILFPIELAHEWWREEVPGWSPQAFHYMAAIDEILNGQEKFFRLNSRSPKDAVMPRAGCISNSSLQILSTIRSSERMLDDLCHFEYADIAPVLCLRDVIPGWSPTRELRVFIRDGQILAVAEYGHEPTLETPPEQDEQLRANVDDFVKTKLAPHLPLDTVVVDLFIPIDYETTQSFTLIELNPYGLSDPVGAISYAAIEEDIPSIARHPQPSA